VAEYTLRQLEYFVAVAEAGSVTGAARAAHLSQSAMSTALAGLERALDVQLLLRHHARGVTLTPAGEQLLVASRRLLVQAAELQAEASDLGRALTGPLNLGCFSVLAPYVLPELLAISAQRYPGLRLETSEEDLDDLAEGVLSGRFELGLSYNLAQDRRLKVRRLFALPPYVLLPAGHALAGRRELALSQLAGEPLALLDLPQSRDYFRGLFERAGVTPVVRYRSSSVETCRALVGRGLAYTLLNLQPMVSTSLDGHPVVSVPLASPAAALDVVLLTAAASRPTRRAAAVAELCAELLRPAAERKSVDPAWPGQ
jgi:DNA-binding transcriptional LysR family regulator